MDLFPGASAGRSLPIQHREFVTLNVCSNGDLDFKSGGTNLAMAAIDLVEHKGAIQIFSSSLETAEARRDMLLTYCMCDTPQHRFQDIELTGLLNDMIALAESTAKKWVGNPSYLQRLQLEIKALKFFRDNYKGD